MRGCWLVGWLVCYRWVVGSIGVVRVSIGVVGVAIVVVGVAIVVDRVSIGVVGVAIVVFRVLVFLSLQLCGLLLPIWWWLVFRSW